MTRADQWKQRPCVLRYRAWADMVRITAFGRNRKMVLAQPTSLTIRAYFDSGKTHRVGPHTVTSDIDNICKSCMDALFLNDQMVYKLEASKYWCDGGVARVEIEWR